MTDITPEAIPIQQESAFTGAPVSQAQITNMGAAINYCLQNAGGVGDIVASMLDLATFQSIRGTTWRLCDGASAGGTLLNSLTGLSNLPDMRGRYPRMKDYGTGRDAAGDLTPGTSYADKTGPHTHNIANVGFGGGPYSGIVSGDGPFNDRIGVWGQQKAIGDNTNVSPPAANTLIETAPKTTVVNFFIKVDN